MTVPQPGDFCVCSAGGLGGKLIRLGEWLNGDAFTQFGHAFIYMGGGRIIQAEPDGARERPLQGHRLELWSTGRLSLTGPQRAAICLAARGYLGTGYSWPDYLALALHHLRIPAPGLRGYIQGTKSMICSQLADRCYQDAGVQLFADGRWNGYVTPAALAAVLETAAAA